MTIEAQFDRIATALEGIAKRIDALGAAIAALNLTAAPAPLAPALPADIAIHDDDEGTPADEAPTPLAPEPKKRGRPALKAVETTPEAAPVAEAAPAPKEEGAPAKPAPNTPAPAEEAPVATEDAVKTAILAFAGKHGKLAALAILERHGAARVRDLNPSTYGAVLADIAKG